MTPCMLMVGELPTMDPIKILAFCTPPCMGRMGSGKLTESCKK